MSVAAIVAERSLTWSDQDLVEAVRAGDDSAFEELYRRYQPGLTRFVHGRVRDHGRAEDVTQEVFVSALRRLRQTDSAIAFRAWIYEIARNASIDSYRRTSRAEEVSIDAEAGLASADARRAGADAAPEASLDRKESLAHLCGALEELSETHHRIIVMRELEGRSYREIGERMRLTPSAVESTLFRARRKLEHEYSELDTGRRCRLVAAAIVRLSEGLESDGDRRRLGRHARRCSACRRRARELGVEPLRLGLVARAAAFVPAPLLMRRRVDTELVGGLGAHGSSVSHAGAALGPSVEIAGGVVGKAVAVVAAAAFMGGAGATLGGAGPLTVHQERGSAPVQPPAVVAPPAERPAQVRPVPARRPKPVRRARGDRSARRSGRKAAVRRGEATPQPSAPASAPASEPKPAPSASQPAAPQSAPAPAAPHAAPEPAPAPGPAPPKSPEPAVSLPPQKPLSSVAPAPVAAPVASAEASIASTPVAAQAATVSQAVL